MRSSKRVMSFPAGTMVIVKDYPFVLRDDVGVMGVPENFGAAMCELAKAEQMQDQAMDSLKCDSVCVGAPNAETAASLQEALATGKGKVAPVSVPDLIYDEAGLFVHQESIQKGHSYSVSNNYRYFCHLTFQDGPVPQNGVNGLTNEALLAILIHRTNVLNEQFPCNENSGAIALMTKAKQAFESRIKRRQAAGIEGKMTEQSVELPTKLRSMVDSE